METKVVHHSSGPVHALFDLRGGRPTRVDLTFNVKDFDPDDVCEKIDTILQGYTENNNLPVGKLAYLWVEGGVEGERHIAASIIAGRVHEKYGWGVDVYMPDGI